MFLVKPYRVCTALDLRVYQDLLDMATTVRERDIPESGDGGVSMQV
jgi:hypothetical protein